jgi:PAS domain S-box-containing protein
MIPVTNSAPEATRGHQEELRRGLFEQIIASALEAIISVDSSQHLLFFNPAAEKMFQVSTATAIGQPLERFIPALVHEEQRRNVEEPGIADANLHPTDQLQVLRCLRADGSEFSAEVSISQTEVGGCKSYTVILRDISERKRAEEALRETGQRLLLAVETAQLGTYERDLLSNEVRVNEECRKILGVPQGALPPDIAPRSAYPQDKERVLAAVARAFDPALREVCAAEFRILRPDGTIRWVAGRGRVVFEEKVTPPRPQKFLGVLLDITERKLAEAELLSAKHELTRINAELEHRVHERTAELQEMIADLEHLSYSMIHDMRAPLRAIQSFAEILKTDLQVQLSEEACQLVQKMRTASHRMDQLLTGALSYNEAMRTSLPTGPANVLQLLQDLLATHPEFKPPHAEVTLEGQFPWVTANEAGLAQCFAELIRNGLKFVEPGKLPRVRIWARQSQNAEAASALDEPRAEVRAASSRSDHWVRLYFKDNGTGIPESGKGRIFDMFQRLHGPEYPGAGVGLALARKVIERMGGRLGVESEEGKGSSFWVELPAPI